MPQPWWPRACTWWRVRNAIFIHAPVAMFAVAVIGCATALFAATIAVVQTDIKRTLAYSTISQLGYMFLACGVGAFGAGMFHLMTHAFFKALLFLGAGSVMHAMSGEQDMRRMGGLRRMIPWTYSTMFVATLAISGTPGFSGFFSKEEILLAARTGPYANPVIYALGVFTAGLTALYMFRLLFLTFHGAPRFDPKKTHVHESPRVMLVPLVVLAVLSLAGGWWAAPHLVGGLNYFDNFVKPVFAAGEASSSTEPYTGSGQLIATVFGPPGDRRFDRISACLVAVSTQSGNAQAPRRKVPRALPSACRQIFHRRTLRRHNRASAPVGLD